MNGEEKKSAAFTLEEIRTFTILAIVLAMIATGIGFVAHSAIAQVLAIVLSVVMMSVAPLAIYFLRRRKNRE